MSKSTEETIDSILRQLCHDFENPKVDSLQAQVDAKIRIEKLSAKRVEEAFKAGVEHAKKDLTDLDDLL